MARQRKKSELPTKPCQVCGRPFTWRKKWANCWDDVKYCSDRCRRRRNQTNSQQSDSQQSDSQQSDSGGK